MRLVLAISLVSMMQTFALNAYTQNTKVSLSVTEMKLEEIIIRIERDTYYRFAYDKNDVNVDRTYSVDVKDAEMKELLNQLFSQGKINYTIVGRQIVLSTSKGQTIAQQPRPIYGKVTDSSGNPLPGVTVVVKGTTQGTITGTDGNYSLTNVSPDVTLVFSFVGMKTQEFLVAGKTNMNVEMTEETVGIEEVVAIGYGSVKKQAVTGAVATANLKTYLNVPVNNILESVKGSIAGLNVGGINKAGAVADITVRGQNTISAGTTPLIVVDGAIFNGSLADIATQDVASLTVLKDASAAAVYGSRSANGVILIETKKGEGINGKPKFNVKMNVGISDQLKPLKLYDGPSYLQRVLDVRETNGSPADPNSMIQYLTQEEAKNYSATTDHKPTLSDSVQYHQPVRPYLRCYSKCL